MPRTPRISPLARAPSSRSKTPSSSPSSSIRSAPPATRSRRCSRPTRQVRSVEVARMQNAARNAMEWFEVVGGRYADTLEPEQFMYSLLTRSQRISHENLRLRDKTWLEGYERWFAARSGVTVLADGADRAADVHAVHDARPDACRTASSSRRWRCIRRSTACRTIFTWSISAAARSAAPAWCSAR